MLRFLPLFLAFSSLPLIPATGKSQYLPNYFPSPIFPGQPTLQVHPYSSVGYIESKFGRSWYSGSGAVASDPRLIYSCAHLFSDIGVWASQVKFSRQYSAIKKPSPKQFAATRGYRLLSGYTPNYFDYQFEKDFAIVFGGLQSSFGPALPKHPELEEALLSESPKMILGYPSYRDYDYASG